MKKYRTPKEIESDINLQTKICSNCKLRKNFEEYSNSKKAVDKKENKCKSCDKERKKNYKEKYPDARKGTSKLYYKNNKKEIDIRNKKWRDNNKERMTKLQKDWYIRNSDKREQYRKDNREKARENRLLAKFNITSKMYDKLLSSQGNKCAICFKEADEENTKKSKFPIDHCHSTGKVRGIICETCNKGLGLFYDNTSFLFSAIEYLNKYKDNLENKES